MWWHTWTLNLWKLLTKTVYHVWQGLEAGSSDHYMCERVCTQTKFTTQNWRTSVCPGSTYSRASEWARHRSRWMNWYTNKILSSNKERERGREGELRLWRITQIVHLKHCIHLTGSSLGGWTALSSDTCSSSAHTRISLPIRQNQVMLSYHMLR